MEPTTVIGKEVLIRQTPVSLFSAFSDLSRFTANLPYEYQDKVVADADSISVNVKGIRLGVVIDKRVPFSLVSLKDDGQSPFPFHFAFHMTAVGLDSSLFHIELSAELNGMLKMMVGGRLQELVDKITDQIEQAVAGQMPDVSKMKPEDFS